MTAETIRRAIHLRLSESQVLDLKRDAYADSKEWIKDVTAFANASGGQILIGVAEDGEARASEAVGVLPPNLDIHISQLESWMRDLTDPDVSDAVSLHVETDETRKFIVVDIEESGRAPHRVLAQGKMQNHVYCRKGRRNVQLSMDEIRDIVLDTYRTPKLISQFVHDRREVLTNDNPLRSHPGRYLVFHVCPRRGFGSRRLVDWALAEGQDQLPEDRHWSRTLPNTLGAYSAYNSTPSFVVDPSYHQVFYNGCAELLYTRVLHQAGEDEDRDQRIIVIGGAIKRYVQSSVSAVIGHMAAATGCSEFEVGTRLSGLVYPLVWKIDGWERQATSTPHQSTFDLPNVLVRVGPNGEASKSDMDEILNLTWRAWGEMTCPIL